MNKKIQITLLLFIVLLLSSCTTTFAGTLFLVTFKDIILYIGISFLIAVVVGFISENVKRSFWICFILNLILTPLSGFIYLLIKITKRKNIE